MLSPSKGGKRGAYKRGGRSFAAAAFAAGWLALTTAAAAQPAGAQVPVIGKGDMAVTGFSGTGLPDGGVPPGIDPLDKTFIDLNGASLRVFDVARLGGAPAGQLVDARAKFSVIAGQIGQVFALAFDAGSAIPPNLYVAATTMHGLQIVAPDAADAGRPKRLRRGGAEARFMKGQWGAAPGAGPGSIWKLDGATGAVTLFVNVIGAGQPNSGPGLGGLAVDPRSRSLYVSDLDTGLIHRFDVDGADRGQFDHGRDGRAARGLPPVADDGRRMDIASIGFDSEDPSTWGFTQPERRVHGLAVERGRLYYAVADGPQIWSVGLADDGSFAGDVRLELEVAAERSPVTGIVFDSRGRMYLAQRGALDNRYDFSRFAEPARSRVLRYARSAPGVRSAPWFEVPDEYAVGFSPDHRMTVGGLTLQYGYRPDGSIDYGACEGTLLKTGDRLRDDPATTAELATVDGVQFTDLTLVRPANVPPLRSYFVDYDGRPGAGDEYGHVGDVKVYRVCDATRAEVPLPGDAPSGETGAPLPEPARDTQPPLPPPSSSPPWSDPLTPPQLCSDAEAKRPDGSCCPSGTKWNATTNTCGPPVTQLCSDAEAKKPDGSCCPSGTKWNAATKGCGPFWSDPVIPLCSNADAKKPDGSCCPNGTKWNAAAKTCGPPVTQLCTDPARLTPDGGCCPVGRKWDAKAGSCEASLCLPERLKPNGQCCPAGRKWNPQTGKCAPQQDRPNIKVEKRTTTVSCAADGVCSFEVVVSNTGAGDYQGPIVLDEVTTPAVPKTGSANAPWTCISYPGGYRCLHPPLTLKAGESVTLKLGFTPGHSFTPGAFMNCASLDFAAAGRTPSGDPAEHRACVTIRVCKPGQANCCGPQRPQQVATPLPPACVGDMVRDAAGRCGCPAGTSWNGRQCLGRPLTENPLDPGRPPPSCSGAGCCPPGTRWDGRHCKSAQLPQCPPATAGIPPHCRTIAQSCPTGTSGIPPHCRTIAQSCPSGTAGTPPHCRTIAQSCPSGTAGTPPHCRTLTRTPVTEKPIPRRPLGNGPVIGVTPTRPPVGQRMPATLMSRPTLRPTVTMMSSGRRR
jgi:hypothetical protein